VRKSSVTATHAGAVGPSYQLRVLQNQGCGPVTCTPRGTSGPGQQHKPAYSAPPVDGCLFELLFLLCCQLADWGQWRERSSCIRLFMQLTALLNHPLVPRVLAAAAAAAVTPRVLILI
jgi:hypothetical protein